MAVERTGLKKSVELCCFSPHERIILHCNSLILPVSFPFSISPSPTANIQANLGSLVVGNGNSAPRELKVRSRR